MASNISEIKQRITSIGSTQKITQAMKLVSFSKLQRYQVMLNEFRPYYNAVSKASEQFLPFDDELDDRKSLYVVFMPDLGLCSAYTQGIMKELHRVVEDNDEVISVGTQFHEFMRRKGLPIVNDVMSSENVNMNEIVLLVKQYLEDRNIIVIIPEFEGSIDLIFTHHPLLTKVSSRRDDTIYEPSFEQTAEMLVRQALNSLLRYGFFASKVSEHMTRRIAMEKATESAQDMIDALQLEYNKARQEAITEELALISGYDETVYVHANLFESQKAINEVDVISSRELTGQERNNIVQEINQHYEGELDVEYSIDQSLMSGLKIRVGNDIYDTSIKSKFKQLLSPE